MIKLSFISKTKLWTCPECGRKFERKGQSHSCKIVPFDKHFEGKPFGKELYKKLKDGLKQKIGYFKPESLECCIHFVSTFTFAAVKIYKEKIRLDFTLNHKLESERIIQSVKMSPNRYLHYMEIIRENEIDEELMKWLQEAYNKTKSK